MYLCHSVSASTPAFDNCCETLRRVLIFREREDNPATALRTVSPRYIYCLTRQTFAWEVLEASKAQMLFFARKTKLWYRCREGKFAAYYAVSDGRF